MTNGKDIVYPAELRQSHFDRMIRRMMADGREVEKLIKRTIKRQEDKKDEC